MIQFKQLELTPAAAKELLATTKKNRAISPRIVAKMARDIRAEKWRLTGETIKVSNKGHLLDGQHRLSAIVMADRTVETVIAYNIDESAFAVIDTGKKRSNADILTIEGHKNATALASALKLQFAVDNCKHPRREEAIISLARSCNNEDMLDLYKSYPELEEITFKIKDMKYSKKILTPSAAAVCYYSFSRIDAPLGKMFFEKLELGADLTSSSPLLYLRNRLSELQNTPGIKRTSSFFTLTAAFMAWNYLIDGKMPKKQWLIHGQPLPILLKPTK